MRYGPPKREPKVLAGIFHAELPAHWYALGGSTPGHGDLKFASNTLK